MRLPSGAVEVASETVSSVINQAVSIVPIERLVEVVNRLRNGWILRKVEWNLGSVGGVVVTSKNPYAPG
jgi:hypothetical protein